MGANPVWVAASHGPSIGGRTSSRVTSRHFDHGRGLVRIRNLKYAKRPDPGSVMNLSETVPFRMGDRTVYESNENSLLDTRHHSYTVFGHGCHGVSLRCWNRDTP